MNMVYVFLFQQGVYMLDVPSLQDDAMCRKKHMWTSGLLFLSAAQGPRLSSVQEGAHNASCIVLHLRLARLQPQGWASTERKSNPGTQRMDSPQFVVSDSDVWWRINALSYALCFLQTDSGFEVLASLAEGARELLKVIS